MPDTNISLALGQHRHQPPGALASLMEANSREDEQIIRCCEHRTDSAQQVADVSHLRTGSSAILPEQFLDRAIVHPNRHVIPIPAAGIDDALRPHLACPEDACITAVPGEGGVSNAPESGLDAPARLAPVRSDPGKQAAAKRASKSVGATGHAKRGPDS